jgi:sulfate transport system substrate-binding protein
MSGHIDSEDAGLEHPYSRRNTWLANVLGGFSLLVLVGLTVGFGHDGVGASSAVTLLNVSYDPTRELYEEYNVAFADHWKRETGETVVIRQSHGGSGMQARAVIGGLEADVVTLASAADIDAIAKAGLLVRDWPTRLPHGAAPYTSTIVFLVRKGNPKHITDWNDLVKPGVSVITPNPKTSGGARWAYLAAYGYALDRFHGSDTAARAFVSRLYHNVPVLDAGARGAATSFLERGLGDVLLAWEDEAQRAVQRIARGKVDIVYPSVSIVAEPVAAVVDASVTQHHTGRVATAYLQYLESPAGQDIIARHFYRPRDARVAARYATRFPLIRRFTIDRFGGWAAVQKAHFAEGGVFDRIYGR